MYRNTLISELVKLIDRSEFKRMVKEHGADKYSKGFGSWQHLASMLMCQFSGVASLREAEIVHSHHASFHYHLHLPALRRSTLSRCNNTRNPAVFRALATYLMSRCRTPSGELGSVLRLIDSSPIIYKGRNNQWTKETSCHRIEGLKLHMSIDPDSKALDYINITDSKVNDVSDAAGMALEPERFIKGFILSDQTIALTNKSPRGGKKNMLAGIALRLIKVARPDGRKPLMIVCNDLEKAAEIIAGHYKARWQIELFFKWIKRYLKVKTFLGENKNSIQIQLYCAIIAYLLMGLRHRLTGHALSTMTQSRLWIQTKPFDRPESEDYVKKRRINNAITSTQLAFAL